MKFDLNLHHEADDELTAAHDFHLKIGGSDLSDGFSDRIESAVDFIFSWPLASPVFPVRHNSVGVRAHSIDESPFSIIYAVSESEILILAFAHEKRRLGYRLHRLNDLVSP